jgi:hypothetical protein
MNEAKAKAFLSNEARQGLFYLIVEAKAKAFLIYTKVNTNLIPRISAVPI